MRLIVKRIFAAGMILFISWTIAEVMIDTEYSKMNKYLYLLGSILAMLWIWMDFWKDQINEQKKQADKIQKDMEYIIDELQKDNGRIECVYALLETNTAQTEREACNMLKIDYDEFLMWKNGINEKMNLEHKEG